MNSIVAAIDIGSTKICAIIAERRDGNLHIIGSGASKAQGLKKGVVTNIELASKAIKSAINDAKRVAGTEFKSAIVSISGAYTKSVNSSGIVNIPNNEIGLKEINRVMQTAIYNANILNEYQILHVLPYNFKVDEQDFIDDPHGMNGSRLEVATHIITVQKYSLNNLQKAIKTAGIEIDSIVLAGYASAISVMKDDERSAGVAVVDMGGSTCNLVVHYGNSIRYNDFIGVGSNHITSDLSIVLHTPLGAAEKLKLRYASLIETKDSEDEIIELPISGEDNKYQEVSSKIVYNVLYERVSEIVALLAKSIDDSRLKGQLGGGIILTGGMSNLSGLREFVSESLGGMPVRAAKPKEIDGLFDYLRDPSFSTAIGLILYANGGFTNYEIDSNRKLRHKNEFGEDLKIVPSTNSVENITIASPTDNNGANSSVPNSITNSTIKLETIKDEKREPQSIKIDTKKNKDNSPVSKFVRWITQLF